MCQFLGDKRGSADVLSWLGTQRRAAGDLDGATNLLEQSLRLYEATGTVTGTAYALLHLGGVAAAQAQLDRAQALFGRSRALSHDMGDGAGVGYATGGLASLALDAGDLALARTLCEEAVSIFRHLGEARGLAEELRLLGRIAGRQGDDRCTVAAFAACLNLRRTQREGDIAFILEGLALGLARLGARDRDPGRLQTAALLLGAASVLRDRLGSAPNNWSVSMPRLIHPELADDIAMIRAALGVTAIEAAWTAGEQMPLDLAIEHALAKATLISNESIETAAR